MKMNSNMFALGMMYSYPVNHQGVELPYIVEATDTVVIATTHVRVVAQSEEEAVRVASEHVEMSDFSADYYSVHVLQ
jgi:hypothetical protein